MEFTDLRDGEHSSGHRGVNMSRCEGLPCFCRPDTTHDDDDDVDDDDDSSSHHYHCEF